MSLCDSKAVEGGGGEKEEGQWVRGDLPIHLQTNSEKNIECDKTKRAEDEVLTELHKLENEKMQIQVIKPQDRTEEQIKTFKSLKDKVSKFKKKHNIQLDKVNVKDMSEEERRVYDDKRKRKSRMSEETKIQEKEQDMKRKAALTEEEAEEKRKRKTELQIKRRNTDKWPQDPVIVCFYVCEKKYGGGPSKVAAQPTCTVGDTVILRIAVNCFPAPSYIWMKDGKTIGCEVGGAFKNMGDAKSEEVSEDDGNSVEKKQIDTNKSSEKTPQDWSWTDNCNGKDRKIMKSSEKGNKFSITSDWIFKTTHLNQAPTIYIGNPNQV